MFNPHSLRTQEIPALVRYFKVAVDGQPAFHMSIMRPHDQRNLRVLVHQVGTYREIGRIDSRGFFTPNASDANEAQKAKAAIDALLPHIYGQLRTVDSLGSICNLTPVKIQPWDGKFADPIESVFETQFDALFNAVMAG